MKTRFNKFVNGSHMMAWLLALSMLGSGIGTLSAEDPPFQPIFNGENLDGWIGDERYWSVEDGVIVGDTRDKDLERNTFLVWDEGEVDDFELRFQYRITSEWANSGVQVRSEHLGDYVVTGYQPDIATVGWITGILFEERGRGVLARRGQRTVIDESGDRTTERFADENDLYEHIRPHDEWTDYHVTGRGNTITTKINGHLMHELVDDAEEARRSGVIAFQLHTGPGMRIEFRDVKLRRLPAEAKEAAVVDDPPNIVLIISDDHSWWEHGFMGHEHVRTPHLDRMAEEGLLYTRGYVPASLCRPSLASIATGLYPYQHRITGNDPEPRGEFDGPWMPSRERSAANRPYVDRMAELSTIADRLGELGYLSHQSGKWWEGSYEVGGFTHGMTHGDRSRGGRHGDAGLAIGRQGMEPVFEFIDMAREERKPFFVWYAPFLPHTPHNPPERLLEKYRRDDRPIELARYYAMIEWFDETCGELIDYVDDAGLGENTIILYVIDNGWIQATPDMDLPEGWTREGYAPGSKRSPNEGGVRTPIIIRWHNRVEPGRDERNLAHSIDLKPTILRAVGLEPSDDRQGINLLDREAVEARDIVYGDIYAHDMPDPVDDPLSGLHYRWTIEGDWKLIVPNPERKPGETIQLYHVMEDPHERNDLAEEHPERVEALLRRINDWLPVD